MTAPLRDQLQASLGAAYTIERELGGGGMSRVFVATEHALGRKVVVKVLPSELIAGVSVERFKREISLAAQLQHPHIVGVLTAGETDGLPFFSMPYVEGESLRARISRQGQLPISETIGILRDVARALEYAHSHGIVHRDIKPDNILITGRSATVTDFGVAKALSSARSPGELEAPGGTLTVVGTSLGTPAYMAPEQAAADPDTDHRADIYSLGITAYEMLAGEPPFKGRSPRELLAAQMAEVPAPIAGKRLDTPPALAVLVMSMLAKDPADRPQSASAIVESLETLVSGSHSGAQWPASGPRTRRTAIIVAALVVVLVGAGIFFARGGSVAAEKTGVSAIRSVAVLPLVNVGGDPKDEYFSDGMSDELTAALKKVPGLQVASRTSAFAFKGRSVDVREIGSKLNVGAVLEGTVRRAGDRLRVAAQLTDARSGLSLWSDSYEREMRDVFVVQDDIARAIVAELIPTLGGAGASASHDSRGTENLEAYDLYLRAGYLWNKRGGENLLKAAEYFTQAIQKDSGFARAYAGLAITNAILPQYTPMPVEEAIRRTQEAAAHAIALDTTLPQTHTALGQVYAHGWEWDRSEAEYRRAIAADPRYATAHHWLGNLLNARGRFEESTKELREAVALDPLSPIIHSGLSQSLAYSGKTEEAVLQGKRAVELDPSSGVVHANVGYAYLISGRMKEAIVELETATTLAPGLSYISGHLVYAYARAGERARALATLQALEERAKREPVPPVALAYAYVGLGQRDKAIAALQRAVDKHDVFIARFGPAAEPPFEVLRDDPRFRALMEHVGLASPPQAAPR